MSSALHNSLGRPGRHHHELLCGIRLTARLFFIPSGVSSLIVQEVCNCSWFPSVKVFNEVCGSSLYSVYLFDVFFLSVGPKLNWRIPCEASQGLCRLPLSLPRGNCPGFTREIWVIDWPSWLCYLHAGPNRGFWTILRLDRGGGWPNLKRFP